MTAMQTDKPDDPCLFTLEKEKKKATFEVTKNCNYGCAHCCTNSVHSTPNRLGLGGVKNVLGQLGENGISVVYTSGGEPFTRKDLPEIVSHANSLPGIERMNIASNGSLVRDTEVEWLKHAEKLGSILISIDGHNEELHNYFRDADRGFQNSVAAVERLSSGDVYVRVGHIIWKQSLPYLAEMADLALELHANELFYNWLVPVGRARDREDIRVGPENYFPTAEKLRALQEEYKGKLNIGFHRFALIDDGFANCPGGRSIIHVNDDGRISPCSWISKLDGSYTTKESMTETPLDRLLETDEIRGFRDMADRRMELYGPGCPAITLTEEGTFYAPDPLRKYIGLYARMMS